MENKDPTKGLGEEVEKKLASCKTKEEVRKVLSEAGVEPLSDEDLDKVAGGIDLRFVTERDSRFDFILSHKGSTQL